MPMIAQTMFPVQVKRSGVLLLGIMMTLQNSGSHCRQPTTLIQDDISPCLAWSLLHTPMSVIKIRLDHLRRRNCLRTICSLILFLSLGVMGSACKLKPVCQEVRGSEGCVGCLARMSRYAMEPASSPSCCSSGSVGCEYSEVVRKVTVENEDVCRS